jgi:polynucleotide 5'-kinase involved in rRNA processing
VGEILNEGWNIHLDQSKFKTIDKWIEHFDKRYLIASLTGGFNVGKTFLTNLLANTGLASGNTNHTSGMSIFETDGIVFIDTEG